MARSSKSTKTEATKSTKTEATKTEATNKYDFDFVNTGIIRGVVNKVLYDGEKVKKYNIDVPTITKNDRISHAFVNVVEYSIDGALQEGSKVNIEFHIATGSYENKDGKKIFTTDIVADVIDEI